MLVLDRGAQRKPMPRLGLVSDAIVRHPSQVGVLGSARERQTLGVVFERPENSKRAIVVTLFQGTLASQQRVSVRSAPFDAQSNQKPAQEATTHRNGGYPRDPNAFNPCEGARASTTPANRTGPRGAPRPACRPLPAHSTPTH